jgi:hypothetical protein
MAKVRRRAASRAISLDMWELRKRAQDTGSALLIPEAGIGFWGMLILDVEGYTFGT